jgi:HSP20 family protein
MSSQRDPFEEIEKMFDAMSDQFTGDVAGGTVPVDVVDEGEQFVLTADLPGYDADEIEVRITDGREVRIAATRDTETENTTGEVVTHERHRQEVSRSVALPETVDEDATEATYDRGVLTLGLPKRGDVDDGTSIPVN